MGKSLPAVSAIGIDLIDHLTGGGLGTFDVPCPLCGPLKRTLAKQCKRVLKVWRRDENFASFNCARCAEHGSSFDPHSKPLDPEKLAKARAEAAQYEREITRQRLSTARWLWHRRRPIIGSVAECYLRARGYSGSLPATLGFLPRWRDHPPALIAAFGMAYELDLGEHEQRWLAERTQTLPSPNDTLIRALLPPPLACSTLSIADEAVVGVHLTKLRPDGSDRIRDDDLDPKVTIGRGFVAPIVLAPMNDLNGLAITEGIEDAISIHEATGLGAWAAGCASRLPTLADSVPGYADCVSIVIDDDPEGRRHAGALARRVAARGIEARPASLQMRAAA